VNIDAEKSDLPEYNLPTKLYWGIMLCLSFAAFGFSAYMSLGFSIIQITTLLVGLAVAALLNQYRFKIPKTQTVISAKELVAFWGIIWLGIPGGVLMAAAAGLAQFSISTKPKKQALFGVFVHTFTTFVAGNVFYFILGSQAGFAKTVVAENALETQWLLIASAAAAAAHYLLFSLLTSSFLKIESDYSFTALWKKNFAWTAVSYLIAAACALVTHLVFLEFGLGFGLVMLPTVVVAHLAYKIHVRRLEQKTREISEASRIHLAMVEALATAIDARDQVGIGHVRRTQIYAVGMGEILGLSAGEIQALNTGALLHDIGKLAVPDHILNKPGRLTPAEMEKTKIHSSVGASILEKINFPYPVVPTIKYHHEMWDGSGYPEGLMKDNIPLTARILSVADAYDTLRGARPYRAAVSRDEARRFLLNGAGTQFDPKIIDVFLRNLRQFEAEIETQGLAYRHDKEHEIRADNPADDSEQSYVEQIKRANREVFTLYELAKVFSSALNLQETLALFADKIGQFVPFETCAVYLLDDKRDDAEAVFVKGKNSTTLKGKRVKVGEGATGYVLKKRQSVYNINPGLDFSFSQLDFIQEYSAMASLPLIANEKLIGAVSLYSCELDNYEDEHMRLLETVSRIASDAIHKSLQHAETESRALTDPMTLLPNARCLQTQFEKELGRASRNGTSFQLLMLDLDGFKAVNDTFGHKTGDELLKGISKVMLGQLRDYDFLARYAGDEFVAIVPETGNEDITDLCRRMEKAVREFALPLADGRFARVGISIGAASYPNHGETLDQIIVAADKAMYRVKAARKEKALLLAAQPPAQPSAARIEEIIEENFIVELDESHVISTAIN
jgi:diguanylate cyclase (GGDEF)-like protein/putative nucleotidyltransferase with HDIG domain